MRRDCAASRADAKCEERVFGGLLSHPSSCPDFDLLRSSYLCFSPPNPLLLFRFPLLGSILVVNRRRESYNQTPLQLFFLRLFS